MYPQNIKSLTTIYPLFLEIKRCLMNCFIGIYVHGSIWLSDFDSKKSDIDFLVVSAHALSHTEKKKAIATCLKYEHLAPTKGLEMSAVTLENCQNFNYPTPFELHYSITPSSWHKVIWMLLLQNARC